LALEFTLPRPGVAEIELLDVRGRRVANARFEPIFAGVQNWVLDAGARFPAGIYLVRLRQGNESVMRRICVLR
jgi:hypothetical protein